MKKYTIQLIICCLTLFGFACKSGLVTMSNSCYKLIDDGKARQKEGNYTDALNDFNQVLQKCNAYDAKEKGYAGKAAALNGLRQYNDALDAANAGLKINKSSIDNLFEKANAELGLGMTAEAKADLQTITDLTSKNQNTADRATIFAKMAEIDSRNRMYDQALQNIQNAIAADNTNADFYIQRGDIHTSAGNFSAALEDYDAAAARGKKTTAYESKAVSIIKMNQQKYGTDNASTLAKKISGADRQNLCSAIRDAQSNGAKNVQMDLVQVAVCK